MPEPSAERSKSFTEEDVAELAEFLCGIDNDVVCRDCTDQAHNAFSFLAAAGRLLPASAEHPEERWRVVLCDPDGTPYARGRHFDSRDEAERWTEDVLCPDPGDTRKLQRRALGPWVEVEGSAP
jgi:hypothetical protein